ncbi:MAG: hypothetical protein N2645_18365 [Clostridia bacterium]|nr:hypothetical protein [Clostridia bacterium]
MSLIAVTDYSMLSGEHGVTSKIKRTLKDIANNFVYIGFLLWEVREKKCYLQDGYSSIVDYAQQELGFSKQTTYNFISVCEKFSATDKEGRPTMHLSLQYKDFSYSQLSEMLSLSPERRRIITSDMTVKQIREVKKEVQTSGLENSENSLKGLITSLKKVEKEPDPLKKIQIMMSEDLIKAPEQDPVIEVEYEVSKTDSRQLPEKYKSLDIDYLEGLIEKEEAVNEMAYWMKEYDHLEQRNRDLEKMKSGLYDLLKEIDKKFNKLTKLQLRNCIADFISTGGEIQFNEN